MIAENSQFSLWAHDRDTLYFSDKFEKIWQAYDARTEATRDLTDDEIAYVQRATARRRLQHQQAIGEETDWDDLFVSPDTQIVIYLKVEDLDLPSGTQIPNGSRDMNHLIYLARGGEFPVYIGKVEGLIADAYWSVSTSTVIFAMQEVGLSIGKRSPYHVWTLNYNDLTISKFFMRNVQEENILIQGITSDGSSVFYRSSNLDGQFLQEYNLFGDTNEVLPVPSSTSYIWNIDNNSLMLLVQEQEGSDQVYIFTLDNNQLKNVNHLPFATYRFSNDVAGISASRQFLSYSPGQGKLMILRLCRID